MPNILRIRDKDGNWVNVPAIKGKDGYTPVKDKDYRDGIDGVSPTAKAVKDGIKTTLTINDVDGSTVVEVVDGIDGEDYVLTEADKHEIADEVKELVPPYDDTEIREDVSRVSESLNQKVGFTDYGTAQKGGVARFDSSYGARVVGDGTLVSNVFDANTYGTRNANTFVSKGTLDNVLEDRGYLTSEDAETVEDISNGKFVLIEEITLTEESTSIVRTNEPDGTPYNFIDVCADAYFPISPSNGQVTFHCYGANTTLSADVVGFVYSDAIRTVATVGVFLSTLIGGFVRETRALSTFNNAWVGSQLPYTNHRCDDRKVKKITIATATTGVKFPIGTRIKIYGVRG